MGILTKVSYGIIHVRVRADTYRVNSHLAVKDILSLSHRHYITIIIIQISLFSIKHYTMFLAINIYICEYNEIVTKIINRRAIAMIN